MLNIVPNHGEFCLIFYANNSAGIEISNSVNIIKDVDDPIITVNFTGDTFGKIAPDFIVSLTEDFLIEMWYTLDGGITNTTFTGLTGTINQDQWDLLTAGDVTITFYAKDIIGNIGSDQVTLKKVLPSAIIPGPNSLLLVGTFSIGLFLIGRKLKIKSKQ